MSFNFRKTENCKKKILKLKLFKKNLQIWLNANVLKMTFSQHALQFLPKENEFDLGGGAFDDG